MNRLAKFFACICFCLSVCQFSLNADTAGHGVIKPGPDSVIKMLNEGNKRFYSGKAEHPRASASRIELAGKESQGKYAYATVLSCSDSRVPVEIIFDAGIMDIFVVRVAGNVCGSDEIGSIEYGLAHVNTPVLVVLGHTKCGAVMAAAAEAQGKGHKLERNIVPLVNKIIPAVQKAANQHKEIMGDGIIPYAVEENVWQAVDDLFTKSPDTRALVKANRVKVVAAIYDIETGKVRWLAHEKVDEILAKAETKK